MDVFSSSLQDISFKPRSAIFSSDDTIPQDIMLMDKVAVYGVQEKKEGVWNRSQHNVFQKVSECARDALRYFSNNHPESAVKWMIMWLGTFRGLFSVPCRGCGKLLYHDSSKLMFLPPTYRTFDTGRTLPSLAHLSQATSYKHIHIMYFACPLQLHSEMSVSVILFVVELQPTNNSQE